MYPSVKNTFPVSTLSTYFLYLISFSLYTLSFVIIPEDTKNKTGHSPFTYHHFKTYTIRNLPRSTHVRHIWTPHVVCPSPYYVLLQHSLALTIPQSALIIFLFTKHAYHHCITPYAPMYHCVNTSLLTSQPPFTETNTSRPHHIKKTTTAKLYYTVSFMFECKPPSVHSSTPSFHQYASLTFLHSVEQYSHKRTTTS